MDEHTQDTQYEAPVVEELSVEEGPATVQAGSTSQQTLFK